MSRRGFIAALAASFMWLAPAMAQQGLRFQTPPDAPLTLSAQNMRWQQTQGISDLKGNVRIVQGPMRMRAITMQIRFAADGTAETIIARGNVELVNDDGQRATAEKADFDIQKDQLVLRDTVRMQARGAGGERQNLSGETLSIDMASGHARLRGGKTRARIELER